MSRKRYFAATVIAGIMVSAATAGDGIGFPRQVVIRGQFLVKFKPHSVKIGYVDGIWTSNSVSVNELLRRYSITRIEPMNRPFVTAHGEHGTTTAANLFILHCPMHQAVEPLLAAFRKHPAVLEAQPTYSQPTNARAGRSLETFVGVDTTFAGVAASRDADIIRYAWDFDGNGTFDWQSETNAATTHKYNKPGVYRAIFGAWASDSTANFDSISVTVKEGHGQPSVVDDAPSVNDTAVKRDADGVLTRFAVMINGGSEPRFWNDVEFMYSTLTEDYDFDADNVHVLNDNGKNPDGENPSGLIDGAATTKAIGDAFDSLAAVVDADDQVFVWVTDHGYGYSGRTSQYYGYLDGDASVDPGDEQDYRERDFKLRSLFTGGRYRCNHGMNVWKVRYDYRSSYSAYEMYRNKYVSRFDNLYFEGSGAAVSDNDAYIERLIDFLLGDKNRDGVIDDSQGEVYDFDGDGIQPYDPVTQIFDEDDWGAIDKFQDNYYGGSLGPGLTYVLFDHGFDNRVDMDINADQSHLEVDGTDTDNAGLFDGIDINDDGDMDDWVSIDEKMLLNGGTMTDDVFAKHVRKLSAASIPIFLEPCFCGGFVDDLSGPGRVIAAATVAEDVSWGNIFVGNFTAALHGATQSGETANADDDNNGRISMMEAFNYAARNDHAEVPQYDDNGDKVSHAHPVPSGGDGILGAATFFASKRDAQSTDVLRRRYPRRKH